MSQSHFVLNLFSIIFFCVGCLLLLISTHQQGIKLIMPDCHSDLKITHNMNRFVTGGNFYETGKEEGTIQQKGSGEFVIPEKTRDNAYSLCGNKIKPPRGQTKTPLVEFVVSGNEIPATQALRLDHGYDPIENVHYAELEAEETENMEMAERAELKFFIGIMSRCCTVESRQARDAIRRTWITHSQSMFTNVDIKFFLSQPELAAADSSIEMVEDELQDNNDIVILRGRDVYENLPNKTFGILRYALSSPKKYTHILKTDDDCYVRVHKLMEILNPLEGPQMQGMYKGCMENRGGFFPIRDQNSKWYIRYDELDDYTAQPIRGTKYLAGWGYILTRDLAFHAMKKVYAWDNRLEEIPVWYPVMKWEDVLMGILVSDKVSFPDADYHFKAAWRACTNETAIRHLDLDAPLLLDGLYAQELSGLWLKKTVQCSTGSYVAGDYGGWKRWRNSVTEAESRI